MGNLFSRRRRTLCNEKELDDAPPPYEALHIEQHDIDLLSAFHALERTLKVSTAATLVRLLHAMACNVQTMDKVVFDGIDLFGNAYNEHACEMILDALTASTPVKFDRVPGGPFQRWEIRGTKEVLLAELERLIGAYKEI